MSPTSYGLINPQTNDSSYTTPTICLGRASIQHSYNPIKRGFLLVAWWVARISSPSLSSLFWVKNTSPKKSMAAGAALKKDRTGIFKYMRWCPPLQAAAYATAEALKMNKPCPNWRPNRSDVLSFSERTRDLRSIHGFADQKVRLLAQRLKFVGHFLENAQKLSMIGVYKPNNLQVRLMQGAMDQLVLTVRALQQSGVFNSLYNLKANDPQLYRDIIGDSAHALYAMYCRW